MFGKPKSGVSYGALIDIGSGSVGVGIVASDHTKKLPTIVYNERIEMRLGARPEVGEELRALREALFSASLNLANFGIPKLRSVDPKAHISRILVTCSSPWSRTVTRSIKFDQKESFKVTDALIHDLRKSAESKIEVEGEEEKVVKKLGYKIVERATVNVKLNGYNINDPIGLKTTSLELAHLSGLVPKEIVDAVDEVHDKVLDNSSLSIHTYLLVFYCVLRDVYPHTHSFCLVDISGEATEFGVVEDDVLIASNFAPQGSNSILRKMSEDLNVPAGHALSLLRGYQEKTLSEEESERVGNYILTYRQSVRDAIVKLYDTHHIPQTVVITSSPEIQGILGEQIMLALAEVTGNLHTMMELEEGFINEIATEGSDVFLAIAGRFFHKLHGCGEIE